MHRFLVSDDRRAILRGPAEMARMAGPRPILQAFLLADHIYVDSRTSKKIVAGIYTEFKVTSFPAQLPTTWAYANLVSVPSEFDVQLRLVDLSNHEVLAESGVMRVQHVLSRLVPHEFVLELPPLRVTHEGAYEFELLVDGEPLKGCRFTVGPIQGQEHSNADHP